MPPFKGKLRMPTTPPSNGALTCTLYPVLPFPRSARCAVQRSMAEQLAELEAALGAARQAQRAWRDRALQVRHCGELAFSWSCVEWQGGWWFCL